MNKRIIQIILLIMAIILTTFSVISTKPQMHKSFSLEQIIFKRAE